MCVCACVCVRSGEERAAILQETREQGARRSYEARIACASSNAAAAVSSALTCVCHIHTRAWPQACTQAQANRVGGCRMRMHNRLRGGTMKLSMRSRKHTHTHTYMHAHAHARTHMHTRPTLSTTTVFFGVSGFVSHVWSRMRRKTSCVASTSSKRLSDAAAMSDPGTFTVRVCVLGDEVGHWCVCVSVNVCVCECQCVRACVRVRVHLVDSNVCMQTTQPKGTCLDGGGLVRFQEVAHGRHGWQSL